MLDSSVNSLVAAWSRLKQTGGCFRLLGSRVKTPLSFIGVLSCGAIRMAGFDSTDAKLKKLLGHESEQEGERV